MLSSRQKPRLLFLYSELADYFLSCIRKLVELHNVEVHVIHWPVNPEAPFKFLLPEGVTFYDRKQFNTQTLKQKVQEISPDFVYCSGWMDKDYLSAVQGKKNKIPVVIGLDTKWEGTVRQQLARILSPFTLNKVFSHCWVPGKKQEEYALKLGFKKDVILTGYYTADTNFFIAIGERIKKKKNIDFPRRFIYVGRYYEFKGIKDLWQAFIQWQEEKNNEWELWCLGTGDIEPISHPKIKHYGFIQPKDIEPFMLQAGVFVMPSRFEPWGVVMHEFAAAGFPLISSDAVGASEAFLREGENGYIYPAGNVSKLKECLSKIASLTDAELIKMGNRSVEMAMKITPEKWVETLMGLMKK